MEKSEHNYSESKTDIPKKRDFAEIVPNMSAEVDHWAKEAQKSNSKYGITKKLGISDNIESFICVGFLGVRLMRQSEGRMRDLIRESDFFHKEIDQRIYDEAEGTRLGALNLNWTINQLSEKFKINPDRKNIMELAVNALTSQCFLKKRSETMIAEVKFNPDKSMLRKWEERWKPELDRLQTTQAQI